MLHLRRTLALLCEPSSEELPCCPRLSAAMVRRFALGHLVFPALMLLLGWALLEAGSIDGLAFLAFLGTPAAVLVLAWAAIVANEIANRRSEKQQRPWSFTKLSLFHLSVPAFMVLLGWWACSAGYISEALFAASAVAPASVLFLAWVAVLANGIANRRSEERQRPVSFTKFSLLVLLVPVVLSLLGWLALQTGFMSGTEVLAFLAAPAIFGVLGWAAVAANEIANRRSEKRQRQG
jgi:hypothetical protein